MTWYSRLIGSAGLIVFFGGLLLALAVALLAASMVRPDRTEAAYARSDLFAKRAVLMADWATFCAKPAADVVARQAARRVGGQ